MTTNEGTPIGIVTHYYPKVSVAVVKLSASVRVGESITVVGTAGEFTQTVSSMQVDHKPVEEGNAGDEVAIMVEQKVREGAEVKKIA